MKIKIGIVAFLITFCIVSGGCGKLSQPSVLHVAIPYSETVQDYDSNYYINWLEEKTGLELEISMIRQERSEEYLDSLFALDTDMDIVFFGGGFEISEEAVNRYAGEGLIYSEEGRTYCENYGSDLEEGAGQILWINRDWLEKLNLYAPKTTEEFLECLEAFKNNDLNGNGIADEIPLVGSYEEYCYMPWEYLLNSFVYNDPYHSRFGFGDENLTVKEDAFREGLKYCHKLYVKELLDERSFSYSLSELSELVNSPVSLVGAFTTRSISDVIYQGNPEIMDRFIHLPPLEGPAQYSLFYREEPRVGAVICGKSKHIEEAKLLLSTMLSEEASLIARYGEKGVDWDFSDGRDVSIYGNSSTIVTINYIWNTTQNKHLNGIGPMNVPKVYIEGVTWNGMNSDAEYIDGRAQMSYRRFFPEAAGLDDVKLHERDEKLSTYIDRKVMEFVKGYLNPESDIEWLKFLSGIPD